MRLTAQLVSFLYLIAVWIAIFWSLWPTASREPTTASSRRELPTLKALAKNFPTDFPVSTSYQPLASAPSMGCRLDGTVPMKLPVQ